MKRSPIEISKIYLRTYAIQIIVGIALIGILIGVAGVFLENDVLSMICFAWPLLWLSIMLLWSIKMSYESRR